MGDVVIQWRRLPGTDHQDAHWLTDGQALDLATNQVTFNEADIQLQGGNILRGAQPDPRVPPELSFLSGIDFDAVDRDDLANTTLERNQPIPPLDEAGQNIVIIVYARDNKIYKLGDWINFAGTTLGFRTALVFDPTDTHVILNQGEGFDFSTAQVDLDGTDFRIGQVGGGPANRNAITIDVGAGQAGPDGPPMMAYISGTPFAHIDKSHLALAQENFEAQFVTVNGIGPEIVVMIHAQDGAIY
ncbi:MAG: hypothetical protein VX930_14005, partial [Pseudomonadota bacterium]|nr:hypothetical protein [Pseudomonadota bacterium]